MGVAGTLLVLIVTAAAVGAWYVNGIYSQVTKLSSNDKSASKKLVPLIPTSDAPISVLVVGSDHRGKSVAGQYGLSDTLMLIRIDPKHHSAALLSIPRDLWVSVPGMGTGKINGAYSIGGDALALTAVKAATGVHPNYLLNVDFSGFRDIVNSLGGVYIQVDQYYYNPPSVSPYSGFSEIDIKPGYQQLSGRDALAFSRYRHTDEDFHRQARQQQFLRAFESRASTRFNGVSVTDIPAITSLLSAISQNMTIVGPGGKRIPIHDLVNFVATAYGVRGHIASVKLPWSLYTGPAGESAVQVSPEALKHAVYQWKHPWTLDTAGKSIPSKHNQKPVKPKWKPAVAPSSVTVSVLNGNGVEGDATKASTQLSGWGYTASSGGNAPKLTYPASIVYYQAGGAKAAADVAHIVGSATTAPLPSTITSTAPVVLVLGKSYKGALAVQPPASTSTGNGPPSTITPDSEFRPYFKAAQGKVHFRTLYPTVSQADSAFCPYSIAPPGAGECSALGPDPIRTYNLPAAGKGSNSMYAMWKLPDNGEFWGIEETKFVKAPILENPNATRDLDGRHYMFFFNGSHIQTVAFVNAGVAYWVQNTLLDGLTNQEIVAIARSLKPVG
jgi:LCP family protein required for cell wall assembly